jgi:iron complex transport system substrate-binding protein
MRVASLLASGTEIVCALGAGDQLVGRSHECDNPPWVRALPSLSEPAFDVTVSSGAIDTEVRRRMRAGDPLYLLENERIADLQPDLIITQAHCEVCAVSPADLKRSGCLISGAAQVMALTAGSLAGVFQGMQSVADALGLAERGRDLVAREKARLEAVRVRCAGRRAPTLVLIEWIEPVFAMANWGPELVEVANGRLLIGTTGEHSAAMAWKRVVEADPEVLVVAPCGFTLARTLDERCLMEALPGWDSLRAVKAGKVAFADGNLYFNRSGMTVTRTAEILAEMLHGQVFGEPTQGTDWQWL